MIKNKTIGKWVFNDKMSWDGDEDIIHWLMEHILYEFSAGDFPIYKNCNVTIIVEELEHLKGELRK